MTSGRWVVVAILGVTALFAAGMWYAQTRAYYDTVPLNALPVTMADGETVNLQLIGAQAIDAETSPLRFRACFNIGPDLAARLVDRAAPATDPTPLVAPAWFDCYSAADIGAALEEGAAQAVLATHEIARGVDRIIAVYPDGRAFAWQQLNGTLDE
ncbi:DUF6446 family protein [Roseicyclus mahoneyensis]|uniref:Histidine kinase n=1 Tax=Roseicyclus mahoneyensis TaxID=164332 RepID=A0A316GJQ0_9RHOB|nr:DUF6446 family protein [Roseicyclus mahoneyensis]PWK60487.1 hypothetical protein C7455_104123 [Roseicyclus mahoneyensis]